MLLLNSLGRRDHFDIASNEILIVLSPFNPSILCRAKDVTGVIDKYCLPVFSNCAIIKSFSEQIPQYNREELA